MGGIVAEGRNCHRKDTPPKSHKVILFQGEDPERAHLFKACRKEQMLLGESRTLNRPSLCHVGFIGDYQQLELCPEAYRKLV